MPAQAAPVADFTAAPLVQTFPNTVIDITNNSVHGAATYNWDFGDGTESDDQGVNSYDFGTWGEFTIQLDIDNGFCEGGGGERGRAESGLNIYVNSDAACMGRS